MAGGRRQVVTAGTPSRSRGCWPCRQNSAPNRLGTRRAGDAYKSHEPFMLRIVMWVTEKSRAA